MKLASKQCELFVVPRSTYRTSQYMSQYSLVVEVPLRKVLCLPNIVQTCEEVRTSSLSSQQSSQYQDVAISTLVSQGQSLFGDIDSVTVTRNILH